jgi:hypothetical protein
VTAYLYKDGHCLRALWTPPFSAWVTKDGKLVYRTKTNQSVSDALKEADEWVRKRQSAPP